LNIVKVLDHYNFQHERIKLNNGEIILVTEYSKNDIYVIGYEEYPQIEDAQEWIDQLSDDTVEEYFSKYNINIWDEVGPGFIVYHGTNKDNVNDILKNGIEARNMSRGISNRGTGNAVFTSQNPEIAYNAYDKVFLIDMGAIKEDSYTPMLSRETALEDSKNRDQLASLISFQKYIRNEYSSEGFDEETIIIHQFIVSGNP